MKPLFSNKVISNTYSLVKIKFDLALNTLVAYLVPLEAEFHVEQHTRSLTSSSLGKNFYDVVNKGCFLRISPLNDTHQS